MYLSLYCKGSKRVTQGLRVRGSWRPNRTAIYWLPLLWPSALCLSRSPGLLNRPGVAFPTTSHLYSNCSLSWQSYIIVQHPLNRPLNLWNGMFDRPQAEITVMQFSGHSLPVHQSMSVPWDFLPCPISLAKHAYAISSHNCHWNVSLPSGASPWNGKFGRVEGQNTTTTHFMIERET